MWEFAFFSGSERRPSLLPAGRALHRQPQGESKEKKLFYWTSVRGGGERGIFCNTVRTRDSRIRWVGRIERNKSARRTWENETVRKSSPHLRKNPVAENAPQDSLPRTKVRKKHSPLFFPPHPMAPQLPPRAKTAAFFLSFFSILGMGAREEGGGKEMLGGEKPLWGKIKEFMAKQKGESGRHLWRRKRPELVLS